YTFSDGPNHAGYCREDENLNIGNDGSIQRQKKDWSDYRKTDPFILICLTIALATIIGGGIAIGIHFAVGGSATSEVVNKASDGHIVPRFPVMQFRSGDYNGTQYINGTLTGNSGVSGFTTVTSNGCGDDNDPIATSIQPTDASTLDATTTIKMTRIQTQTQTKSIQGTAVSSAKPVNATVSRTAITEFPNIVTHVVTTSVTETQFYTATETQGDITSEYSTNSNEATSKIHNSVDVTSIVLTRTLTETPKSTSTIDEVVSTVTYTPTTVIRQTVTVTSKLLSTSTRGAQCSPNNHTVYITVTETAFPSSSVSPSVVPKTSSSSSVAASRSTDTALVTMTITIDSPTPPTKVSVTSPSSGANDSLTATIISHSKTTITETDRSVRTIFVTITAGKPITLSTTVSSALGHAGTPIFTSRPVSEPSDLTETVFVTKTITDEITHTVSSSSSSADVVTSVATVPAPLKSSKSIFTTIVLTDRATKTLTAGGGNKTITVYPKKPTITADLKVITEVDINTITVTVGGGVGTTQVTVSENATAKFTQTELVTETATATHGESSLVYNRNASLQMATVNTTIYITGTPMMHPVAPTATPPFPNGTMTHSMTSISTRTMPVVVSHAEKRAEPITIGVTGGGHTCTTCLVIFILGLLVLF
ncbi:hypothetical protein CCHL11_05599, partial [Colletotrichum chlorophyti]